ncbi:MAG: hypothetical protein RL434_2159, partial [Pseudomonadota bacterium]
MATFTGDSSNNLLEGGNDEDVLLGKDGDDTLVGGLGNDVLLGGNGTDLARFSGRFSDYSLFSSTLPTAIVGPDGTDYLTSSLELLKFEDASVRLRWQSALVPLTGDIQVNTYIDGAQSSSAVAGLGDGGHVVVWTSESQDGDNLGVFGQRYSIHGALIGPEFQVNSSATGAQLEPVVASLAGGGFVVVWTSELSGAIDVFAQRYDAAGARTGGEFRINTASGGDQYDSALAALADGSFIISWTSESQDGDGQGVYAQRCAADGTFLGGEFRVNTNVAGAQDASAVTALADGGFVVTWTSLHADGQGDIYAQLYALGGTPVGSEFKVNTQTTGAQLDSAVAGLVDGGFVVTWTSVGQDGDSNGVYAQRYAATGEALGSEFRVNTVTVDSQSESAVAALADGGFIVTWSSLGQDGNLRGIYAQVYSSAGIPQGPEFLVNTFVDNVQSGSAVAGLAGDGFVVTWDSYSQDNSELPSFGIFAKRYQLPLAGIEVTGDASDQSLTGSSGSDTLQGNGGKDVIDGGDGVDTARYSENTAAQGVRVTLTGATLSDARVAGVVEDRLRNIENLIGGSGRDTFIGDLRANRLVGNDGNDTLQGRGGKDILDGGKGIDTVSFADKTSTQGVRVTLAGLTLSDARVAGVVEDRLRGIENLIGGAGKDSLTGDKLANTLSGLGGNDRLDGKSGNDSLSGGLGNDILLGGLGNDLLDGGDGVDTASYVEKTAIQSLRITLAGADAVDVLVAGLAEDSLRNVENLIGGAGRDTFVGDERANSLVGGGGNDLLLGGTGKDTLEGGLGIDTAIYTDKTDSQGVSVTLNG